MRSARQKNAARPYLLYGRSIAMLALTALLSLWTLGTLHAVEHEFRQDPTPCGTCIAIASHGLESAGETNVAAPAAQGAALAESHHDPEITQRALRLAARAPPTPRA